MSIQSEHYLDEHGNPAGGVTQGTGFVIAWQHGPLGRGAARRPATGAFVEDVIAAAIDRLEHYQDSPFSCEENAEALAHLAAALRPLHRRTADRELRNVEGTHAR